MNMLTESPLLWTILTSFVYLSAVLLPVFFVYRIWIHIRRKQLESNTLIDPINTVLPCHTSKVQTPTSVEPVQLDKVLSTSLSSSSLSNQTPLVELVSSVRFAPKDSRRPGCADRPNAGEDAFFTYSNESVESVDGVRLVGAMGIADGVGGYADLGVDAGLMAWQIMDNSLSYFRDSTSELFVTPRDILHYSYEDIKNKKQVDCGGTTVCLLSIFTNENNDLKLQYSNLGDSGFLLVRNGKIIFRTQDQTHYFNAPYQLAIPPKNRTVIMNEPYEADQLPNDELLTVQEGDYIILATDGVWDNIFDEELVEILKSNEKKFENEPKMITETTATEILKKTSAVSLNSPHAVMTPFQKYAMDNRKNWIGGKVDDITVSVARISAWTNK